MTKNWHMLSINYTHKHIGTTPWITKLQLDAEKDALFSTHWWTFSPASPHLPQTNPRLLRRPNPHCLPHGWVSFAEAKLLKIQNQSSLRLKLDHTKVSWARNDWQPNLYDKFWSKSPLLDFLRSILPKLWGLQLQHYRFSSWVVRRPTPLSNSNRVTRLGPIT